jgi:Tol biopolymer transport system component/predicted Ser/Thr protein kinase
MNQERWKQIDELFDAVLDLPEAAREEFLSEQCGGDEDLRNEVLSLLNANTVSNNFLEKSAMGVVARNLADEQAVAFDAHFIGQTIGTYHIEKPIGAGGMGEVYLAYDEKLKRKVALKILPAEYTSNDERVKRFELEARAISALNHPNIVTIYDVGNAGGVNFIATEFVEGRTLRELIGTNLKLKEVLEIILQACAALSAAHNARIIHRDIKPENIMVRPDGYVKILDFGLAKLTEIDLNTMRNFTGTAKGIIIGTPAYMSPEQVADDNVDHRTDLWSIGVVLYELLTGVNPFKKENRQATFQAILSQEPPPASSLNPEISTELDQILVKALEKEADLSYQTASDLRADLKRVKREVDSSPSWNRSGSLSAQNLKSAKRRRNYWLFGSAILFLALTGFGIWFFARQTISSQPREATEWINASHAQLTDSPWIEGYPSLSPDGKNIIFASDSNNDRNIYLLRVGGKNLTNLTQNSKESDTMPAYSPDGKYIAFRSDRTPSGIYVMEETGENVRRISDIGFHPSWTSDGKKVVVSDKAAAIHTVHTVPNSSLWAVDLKTGEKQKLETRGDAIMPNCSPNGYRIAFWYVADGKLPNIATIPADGGEPVIIAESDASDWNPVWSPDGKYLYFSSDRKGSMNLWRVSVDEKTGAQLGEPESVTTPSKYLRHITVSRDGKTIGYVRYESQSNVQGISFDTKTLKVTGEAAYITRGDREVGNPVLAPDGELFVARNPTRTQEDLVVFDKKGENWRNLTDDKFRERLPRWSPDGKKIAFHTDRSGQYQIWTINADGSNLEQLTFSDKTAAISPVFSPDGTKLAFTEVGEKSQISRILDLTKSWAEQTPQNLQMATENLSYSVRDWSKDGKKLLVIFFEPDGDEKGTGVFDLEKRSFEKMTDSGSSPVWLNDNRHFIFIDRNTLFLCDTTTKKITGLYKPSSYEIQQAVPSPDNKTIFFRYLQVDADVWLLDSTQNQ